LFVVSLAALCLLLLVELREKSLKIRELEQRPKRQAQALREYSQATSGLDAQRTEQEALQRSRQVVSSIAAFPHPPVSASVVPISADPATPSGSSEPEVPPAVLPAGEEMTVLKLISRPITRQARAGASIVGQARGPSPSRGGEVIYVYCHSPEDLPGLQAALCEAANEFLEKPSATGSRQCTAYDRTVMPAIPAGVQKIYYVTLVFRRDVDLDALIPTYQQVNTA
jgi:hypothetical protein